MKLPPFTVHRPGSVGQASRLLAELGDDGAAYCGGTELLLAMKLGLASYEHLVDLKRVYGLRGIGTDGGAVRIGAGATLACQRGDELRRVPAAEFLTGLYETALAPGELLTAVELPARPDRTGLSHLRMKLTERPVVTVTALVTLSASASVAQARLIVGSVGSVPFAADAASLIGAAPADFPARAGACADQAAAACAPLPDGEASPDYLRHLVAVHARQALGEAFASAAA